MFHETLAHCETPLVGALPKRSPFGALFSRTLPAYAGQYPVGVRDVEVPIPRQSFGNFKHNSMPDGEAGITIDTVMFTLFYPTELTLRSRGQMVWFPRLRQTVDGLLKMSNKPYNWFYNTVAYGGVAAMIRGTTFPGIKDAPLKPPPESNKQWRLILFSHGAGSSRLMNSAVCGELASRGYVVAVIEHRDGTGPSSRITNEAGETKDLYWLNWSDLEWASFDLEEQPKDDATLRHVQLEVRLAELEGIIEALRRLARGEPLVLTGQTGLSRDWSGWDRMDVTNPIIGGHSFGGSLAMAAAADGRFKFSHVVVFDPATQRLEPWNKCISAPLLAINSEEFATGVEFTKLLAMAPSAATHELYVIPGSTHPAFSDIFLILPNYVNKLFGLAADPGRVIDLTIDTTRRFLENEEDNTDRIVRHVSGSLTKGEVGDINSLVRCHREDSV
ncbi:hypothetical protein HYDPIDRAFT_168739 [Hydnomerulius pinastri MD-312]|uniref:1-alkyl-2-acetylglycerophosphocholine esterase n=1 Tax=Hydnomerulius pinastri MD-312 TaxID=994086 RepID=A0A0C9W7K4_9AGAM|nr:hypothetical protein HYDPIDRAFT_168739 [Hydnomerulius pinastri MD-312]